MFIITYNTHWKDCIFMKNKLYFRIQIIYFRHKIWSDLLIMIIMFIINIIINNSIIYADDRTLYDQMNERTPEHYTTKIKYSNGDSVHYHLDGTVTVKYAPLEIHVKELFPGNPAQGQQYATELIEMTKVRTSNGDFIDGNDTIEVNNYPLITGILNNKLDATPIIDNFVEKVYKKIDFQTEWLEVMEYVENVIPKELWAKTESEIKSDDSDINVFLDYIQNNIAITTSEQYISYVLFRAAVSSYNVLLLNNMTDFTITLNAQVAAKVYFEGVNKIAALVEV